MTREAVIVDAVRTPLGRRDGMLKGWHPVDLLAYTLNGLVARNKLDPATIDDVIAGCVMQVGEQSLNVARNAVLAASRIRSRHYRGPPVWIEPASSPLCSARRDCREL